VLCYGFVRRSTFVTVLFKRSAEGVSNLFFLIAVNFRSVLRTNGYFELKQELCPNWVVVRVYPRFWVGFALDAAVFESVINQYVVYLIKVFKVPVGLVSHSRWGLVSAELLTGFVEFGVTYT